MNAKLVDDRRVEHGIQPDDDPLGPGGISTRTETSRKRGQPRGGRLIELTVAYAAEGLIVLIYVCVVANVKRIGVCDLVPRRYVIALRPGLD